MTVLATICASQAKGGAMKIVPAFGALRAKTVAFEQDKSERGHSGARPTARPRLGTGRSWLRPPAAARQRRQRQRPLCDVHCPRQRGHTLGDGRGRRRGHRRQCSCRGNPGTRRELLQCRAHRLVPQDRRRGAGLPQAHHRDAEAQAVAAHPLLFCLPLSNCHLRHRGGLPGGLRGAFSLPLAARGKAGRFRHSRQTRYSG